MEGEAQSQLDKKRREKKQQVNRKLDPNYRKDEREPRVMSLVSSRFS